MKRLIAGFLLSGLILVIPAHATEIYKCKGDTGQTIFSQQPCANDAEKIKVKIDSPSGDEFTKNELELIAAKKVSIGMSEAALVRSWGRPNKINKSGHGAAQWIYDHSQYVYVENGVVTNWQSSE